MAVEVKELIVKARVGKTKNYDDKDVVKIIRQEIEKSNISLSHKKRRALIADIVSEVFEELQNKMNY